MLTMQQMDWMFGNGYSRADIDAAQDAEYDKADEARQMADDEPMETCDED